MAQLGKHATCKHHVKCTHLASFWTPCQRHPVGHHVNCMLCAMLLVPCCLCLITGKCVRLIYYEDFSLKGVNAKLGSMSWSQLGDPCNMIYRAMAYCIIFNDCKYIQRFYFKYIERILIFKINDAAYCSSWTLVISNNLRIISIFHVKLSYLVSTLG